MKALADNWSEESEKEVHQEDNIIYQIRATTFVSSSNGRNRKPRKPREVTLLCYPRGSNTWKEWNHFPFDTVATEMYPIHTEREGGLASESLLIERCQNLLGSDQLS